MLLINDHAPKMAKVGLVKGEIEMKKNIILLTFMIVMILTLVLISSAVAAPGALSAKFSKNAISCGIYWFNPKWKPIWIEGTGRIIHNVDGGYVMTCDFTLDLNDPDLLSREEFCAADWAKFMCQGDGALVDNRTTCNIAGDEVHNGTVVAGPSGEGMFVCHVK